MKKYKNIINHLLTFTNNDKLENFLSNTLFYEEISENEKYFLELKNTKKINEKFVIPNFLENKQSDLYKELKKIKGVLSITAPTSFGKTFTLLKYSLNEHKRILIISPTLSLCTEYFFNIKYKYKNYGIEWKPNPSMSPNIESDIYILTPEKAKILNEKSGNINFDIVIFDEFYEAFSSHRMMVFYEAYNFALKVSKKIALVLPAKSKLPNDIKIDQAFVTDISLTYRKFTKYVYDKKINSTFKLKYTDFDDENSIGNLVDEIKGKVKPEYLINEWLKKYSNKKIIVIESKKGMYTISNDLIKNRENLKKIGPITNELIKYFEEIAPNTILVQALKKGIAYHNGSVDKFARTLIESAFSKGELKVLFANSTISKGVNLNPDILFINSYSFISKMNDSIKRIEINNLIGRTGRTILKMNQVGNVVINISVGSKNLHIDNSAKRDNKQENIIKKNILENPKRINSFEAAYKNLIIDKTKLIITEADAKIIMNWFVRKGLDNETNVASDLIDLVYKKFKIKFDHEFLKTQNNMLIKSYLFKQGYSKNYKRQRNDLIRKNLFIKDNGWITKNEKDGKKFIRGSYYEDILLAKNVGDYEEIAGYYFAYLLNHIYKEAYIQGVITKEIYDRHIDSQEEDDKINTVNGWPSSFGPVAISNTISKNKLDIILKLIID